MPIDGKIKRPQLRAGQEGIALPVALVAALVLVIGLGALASRTSQGVISSYFQGVNREARDVAESAIVDFGNTMNREENRLLLVAGNDEISSWSDAKHRNSCTAFDSNGQPISGSTPASVSASALRFVRGADWQNLVANNSSRQFRVTGVEYLYEQGMGSSAVRIPFSFATQNINIPDDTVRDLALGGGTRTLMRVTIVGRVEKNGRTSFARVAREFEIVPKCCKRSFGGNAGLVRWGRDVIPCPAFDPSGGDGRGIVGGLSGGQPSGSNNTLDIRDQNDNLVTQAICWSGNLDATNSDLSATPNQDCVNGDQELGVSSPNRPGITFVPEEFDLRLPSPPTVSQMPPQSLNRNSVIYFDPSYQVNGSPVPSVLLRVGNTTQSLNSYCSPQVPPGQINCLFTSFDVGSNRLIIDASNSAFNFHFASGGSPGYMASSGSGSYVLADCGSSSVPGECTSPVSLENFLLQPDKFNAFTMGSGTFDIRGGSSTAGMNIYAPNATVTLRGGGNANPNFMGRIWANSIDLRGNVKIRTLASNPGFCSNIGVSCPPSSGRPLFDLVARSFSHASGF